MAGESAGPAISSLHLPPARLNLSGTWCPSGRRRDAGWIRNDLAVTQYHLGRLSECQATLAPLAEDAAKTADELRRVFPPFDFGVYWPILQATRHNLRLCAGGR